MSKRTPAPLPEPEYASVEAFVQHCMDDDRTTFRPGDAQKVALRTRATVRAVLDELASFGLQVEVESNRRVRGFTTSSNDRYFGPGSEPMHGGSGWVQVNGFATAEGY